MFADLHIHTNRSDGSDSCRQILDQAVQNHVSVIAVTDHNTVAAYSELKRLLPEYEGLRILPGAELDGLLDGRDYHILGLGIDVENPRLLEACRYNADAQETYNQTLLKILCKEEPSLSLTEYLSYTQPQGRGGWKLLNYLLDKGVTSSLREGMGCYARHEFSNHKIPFLSVSEAASVIRESGGIPLLAHPIDIPLAPLSEPFLEVLRAHLQCGVLGVECIYPMHSRAIENGLLEFCRQNHLYASGGTDYHGEFFSGQKQKIGGQFVREEQIHKLLDDTVCL